MMDMACKDPLNSDEVFDAISHPLRTKILKACKTGMGNGFWCGR